VHASDLPEIPINPKEAPPSVSVKPVVGGRPEALMTLDEFREEWPLLRTEFLIARELFEAMNPGSASDLGTSPTLDELLEVSMSYVDRRVTPMRVDGNSSDPRDVGIPFWRGQVVDLLDTVIRGAGAGQVKPVPILENPKWLDSDQLKRFQWTGIFAEGKRSHPSKIPCHTDLEKRFADFLDVAKGVVRYIKNERFRFSLTYYEGNRPRQYFPDFIIFARGDGGRDITWLAETKGEIRPNTRLKTEAARLWCEKMSTTAFGQWRYLFIKEREFDRARSTAQNLTDLASLVAT
jgi:hypothetical protein